MRAGSLRHRITLQKQERVIDEYGGVSPDLCWTDAATVWASFDRLSGQEFWASQQTQSEASVQIRIRYLPGVNTTMRVTHKDVFYNIVGILPDNKNRELILMCKEFSFEQQDTDRH